MQKVTVYRCMRPDGGVSHAECADTDNPNAREKIPGSEALTGKTSFLVFDRSKISWTEI